MTKKEMISTIQKKEAVLWLALVTYENENAPDSGNDDERLTWEETDAGYNERLNVWYEVNCLMESIGIEANTDLPEKKEAFSLAMELWSRREVNRANNDTFDSDYMIESDVEKTARGWETRTYYIVRISNGAERMERFTSCVDAIENLELYRGLEKAEKEV